MVPGGPLETALSSGHWDLRLKRVYADFLLLVWATWILILFNMETWHCKPSNSTTECFIFRQYKKVWDRVISAVPCYYLLLLVLLKCTNRCQVNTVYYQDNHWNLSVWYLQDIVSATAACEEVKQSGKFKRLLELVLLIGNYMNAGSKKERSVGFEMNFLTKVSRSDSVGYVLDSCTSSCQCMFSRCRHQLFSLPP